MNEGLSPGMPPVGAITKYDLTNQTAEITLDGTDWGLVGKNYAMFLNCNVMHDPDVFDPMNIFIPYLLHVFLDSELYAPLNEGPMIENFESNVNLEPG